MPRAKQTTSDNLSVKPKSKAKNAGDIPITVTTSSVVDIEVSRIGVSRFEPQKRRRARFRDEDTAALGQSIRVNGLKQPIQIRPVKPLDDFKSEYEIVFGERRFLASKFIGAKTIRCFVEDLSDAQVLELQYEENHRRQENSPLDDAFLFKFLIETEGYDEKKLADKFNKSVRNIKQMLSLNELVPEAVALFESGKLPLKHATYMAKFHEAAQKEIFEEGMMWRYGDEDDGIADFEEFKDSIEEEIIRKLADAPFDPEDKRLNLKGLKCSECLKNTHFQKVLFPEFEAEARCMDKVCFDAKTRIHLTLIRDEIAEKMIAENSPAKTIEQAVKAVPLVTSSSYVDNENLPFKEKVLTNQKILPEPECEFSTIALSVKGEQKGQEVYICAEKKCPVHDAHSKAKSVDDLSDFQRENLENEFTVKVGLAVREQIFAESIRFFESGKTVWEFADLVEKLLCKLLFSRRTYFANALKNVIKQFPKCPAGFGDDELNAKFVSGLQPFQKQQLLFLCIFAETGYMSWRPEPQDEVKELAKNYCKAAINYELLDAETRLKLAPDEFKDLAAKHLENVRNGEKSEIPSFWVKEKK